MIVWVREHVCQQKREDLKKERTCATGGGSRGGY
jgi:hypothetical protein